jgi:hypothetical protein
LQALSLPPAAHAWKLRYAYVSAVGQAADLVDDDGAALGMTRCLIQLAADPHPRVRSAAFCTLWQFGQFQRPPFQGIAHAVVMPALQQGLHDACRRVRAQACSALCSLKAEDAITAPYVGGIFEALVALLLGKTGANTAKGPLAAGVVSTPSGIGLGRGDLWTQMEAILALSSCTMFSSFMPISLLGFESVMAVAAELSRLCSGFGDLGTFLWKCIGRSLVGPLPPAFARAAPPVGLPTAFASATGACVG